MMSEDNDLGRPSATCSRASTEPASGLGPTGFDQAQEWRCFHCGEAYSTVEDARIHFGDYDGVTPLCIEATTADVWSLIRTNRELWDRVREAETDNETLGFNLSNFEYTARKLTRKPSAHTSDLIMAWDSMEGRVLAAEAAINAAPKWLRSFLRKRAERRWRASRPSLSHTPHSEKDM